MEHPAAYIPSMTTISLLQTALDNTATLLAIVIGVLGLVDRRDDGRHR